MLKASVIDGTNVVGLTLDGSVSADEEDAAQQTIADVAAEHGSAQMLLDYEGIDLSRVEPKAAWKYLKGARLLSDISRVAIVGDSSALEAFAKAAGAVTDLEVQTFDALQRDEAVAWLSSSTTH